MEEKSEKKEIQEALLNILVEFVRICDKNDLNYYISGGTFLGAVRHKGFIPWDDDVDVAMPRNDYNKFLELAKEQLPKELNLAHYLYSENIIHYFAKIEDKRYKLIDETAAIPRKVNLWIDIFPLDGLPDNKIKKDIHCFTLLVLRALFKYSLFDRIVDQNNTERPMYEKILVFIGKKIKFTRVLNPYKRMKALDVTLSKYDFYESTYVLNFMGSYKLKSIMNREKIYANGAIYEFEEHWFRGPENYNDYLTQIYGDYMKLPPLDKRNWHQTTVINE